jgi:hypothetical protein
VIYLYSSKERSRERGTNRTLVRFNASEGSHAWMRAARRLKCEMKNTIARGIPGFTDREDAGSSPARRDHAPLLAEGMRVESRSHDESAARRDNL